MDNGIYKQRKEIREALLTCFSSDDIKELLLNLYEMAREKNNKPSDRIKASQVILEYTIGKPKQNLDLTTQGEGVQTVILDIFQDDKINNE